MVCETISTMVTYSFITVHTLRKVFGLMEASKDLLPLCQTQDVPNSYLSQWRPHVEETDLMDLTDGEPTTMCRGNSSYRNIHYTTFVGIQCSRESTSSLQRQCQTETDLIEDRLNIGILHQSPVSDELCSPMCYDMEDSSMVLPSGMCSLELHISLGSGM